MCDTASVASTHFEDAHEELLQFYERVIQTQSHTIRQLQKVAVPEVSSEHCGADADVIRALREELAMVYRSETWLLGVRLRRLAATTRLDAPGARLIRLLDRR